MAEKELKEGVKELSISEEKKTEQVEEVKEKKEEDEELDSMELEGIRNLSNKSMLFSTKITSWKDPKLHLTEELTDALNDMGFDQPSKIQAITIPIVASAPYPNFIAQSQNGSGKTLAFVLGSCLRIDPALKDPQVLVISPNRELANQTFTVYSAVTKFMKDIKVALNVPDGEKALGQVIVGTPGSLMKMVDANKSKFKDLKVFIVDEADMAFDAKSDLGKIIVPLYKKTNPKKQTLLFSATYTESILGRARELVKEASIVKLTPQQLTLKGVIQCYINVAEGQRKFDFVNTLLKSISFPKLIVFCNTKKFAENFAKYLTAQKYCKVSFSSP